MDALEGRAELRKADGSVLAAGLARLNGYRPPGVNDAPWGGTFLCDDVDNADDAFREATQIVLATGRTGSIVATTRTERSISIIGAGRRPF